MTFQEFVKKVMNIAGWIATGISLLATVRGLLEENPDYWIPFFAIFLFLLFTLHISQIKKNTKDIKDLKENIDQKFKNIKREIDFYKITKEYDKRIAILEHDKRKR